MNVPGLISGLGLGLLAPREVARRHLRRGISVEGFFDELNRHGVRYAVLRWFETLPDVDPDEDIDILIADEDVPLLRSLLRSHRVAPARQKFDVYSVTGLPGSDYRGIPYLTPTLATRLLERSVLLRGRYRVPCPEDHFDSLAYHAVYHKGERSGLPSCADTVRFPAAAAEHDYVDVLAGLAARLSLPVRISMEDLDTHLAGKGLRPPLDTLEKLSGSNEWLRSRLEEEFGPADAGLPGLAVFVVREKAAHLIDRLREELLREGWEPLEWVRFDAATAAHVRSTVRGGNWGSGPWPVSGGGPSGYLVAYDLSAAAPAQPAGSDGDRVTATKLAIRRRLLSTQPDDAQFNPLHSSDNPRQALDYLAALDDPARVGRLRQQIADLRTAMIFPYPVVELLPSNRRRALTAVVRHPEFGECVCKLFYPSADRFRLRELRARTEFADLPEVPRLLEAGGTWLLSPRYTDTGEHLRRALPDSPHSQLTPRASRALARLARTLHERHAFLLDLTPLNLMTDPEQGLKVLDWEFLQDLPADTGALSGSPTVRGRVRGDWRVDTPLGVSECGDSVVTALSATVTGLPAAILLHAPIRLLTPVAELGMVIAFLIRAARTGVKRGKHGSERTLRRAVRAAVVRLERRPGAAGGTAR